jgi:hypothetical protein
MCVLCSTLFHNYLHLFVRFYLLELCFVMFFLCLFSCFVCVFFILRILRFCIVSSFLCGCLFTLFNKIPTTATRWKPSCSKYHITSCHIVYHIYTGSVECSDGWVATFQGHVLALLQNAGKYTYVSQKCWFPKTRLYGIVTHQMVLRMSIALNTLNLLKNCMYKTSLIYRIILNKITYLQSCKQ